jgi:hypothetical protein
MVYVDTILYISSSLYMLSQNNRYAISKQYQEVTFG